MVNLLETLYALTALAFMTAAVQLIRKRAQSSRRFLWAEAIGAALCVAMDWYLRPSA